MKKLLLLVCVFLFVFGIVAVDAAGIIDFETLPDGSASTDNYLLGLNEAYVIDGVSVTFGFDTDNDGLPDQRAYIEEIGESDSGSGFTNDDKGIKDTAAADYEELLGEFFLRPSGALNNGEKLIIAYNSTTAVTAASGEIWDIDGYDSYYESYIVSAFDGDHILLATINSPKEYGLALDGKPWQWGFEGLTDIAQIEIMLDTNKDGAGLAFNNFSPLTNIPIPGAVWLFASGLIGLVGIRRRFQK